jgi:anti-anti-sigma factor
MLLYIKEFAMPNVIKITKRFDYSASSVFNASLSAALNAGTEDALIQLDCIHLDHIDSAGIGLLVMAHKQALSCGVSMEIIHAKPAVKEILGLANLQMLMNIQ